MTNVVGVIGFLDLEDLGDRVWTSRVCRVVVSLWDVVSVLFVLFFFNGII